MPGLGRRQLRHQIAAFFASPQIAELAQVLPAMPKLIPGTAFADPTTPTGGTGAVAYVFLERDWQRRIAVGGAISGQKLRYYTAHLRVTLKSVLQPSAAGVDDAGVQAMDAFDDLAELIVARLLSDRTLGNTVWQVGEGANLYGEDVVLVQPEPYRSNEAIWVFGDLQFTVIDALVNT